MLFIIESSLPHKGFVWRNRNCPYLFEEGTTRRRAIERAREVRELERECDVFIIPVAVLSLLLPIAHWRACASA